MSSKWNLTDLEDNDDDCGGGGGCGGSRRRIYDTYKKTQPKRIDKKVCILKARNLFFTQYHNIFQLFEAFHVDRTYAEKEIEGSSYQS